MHVCGLGCKRKNKTEKEFAESYIIYELSVKMSAVQRLLFVLLFVSGTRADECEDVGTENLIVCPYYYNQLEDALTSNRNELYWLHRVFFPEQRESPHTLWLTVEIEVVNLNNNSCNSNNPHRAYYHDGAIWKGKWKFLLGESILLYFVSPDVLFAFDDTISFAVHAMATGLESSELKEYSLRIRLQRLPCMPTSRIMTEVLTTLMSRVSIMQNTCL